MQNQICSARALCWFLDETEPYEVECGRAQVVLLKQNLQIRNWVLVDDLTLGLLFTLASEWDHASSQELHCDNTQCPDVHFFVVTLVLHELGCHEAKRAKRSVITHRLLINLKDSRVSKICQLHVRLIVNIKVFHEYVFWLHIAMADALLVQVIDSLEQLLHDVDDC